MRRVLSTPGRPIDLDRELQALARIDRRVPRGRNAEQLEGAFFAEPVLGAPQRAQRRRDARLARQIFERLDRNVLPVEREHVAALRELT